MHAGGADRLQNWPFSQLSDHSDLELNLGLVHMAHSRA